MTPFRAELRALGLTCRSFARLTGLHEETVTGWGTVRGANLQVVPLWAWRLVDAWKAAPHALAACEAPPDGFSP